MLVTTRIVSEKAARLLKKAGILLFPAWMQKELLWSPEEYQTFRFWLRDMQDTAPAWWTPDEFAPLPLVLQQAFEQHGRDLCNAQNHNWPQVVAESLSSMSPSRVILLCTPQLFLCSQSASFIIS